MTSFALKRPVTVLMLALGLCLLGAISWRLLPLQLMPQFILPEVYVSSGMAGASPEKIERELAFPIWENYFFLARFFETCYLLGRINRLSRSQF